MAVHYHNKTTSQSRSMPQLKFNIRIYNSFEIKTHGSESRGQEEAACMRVFWPTRPLQ